MFVHVPLNSALSMTARIEAVAHVSGAIEDTRISIDSELSDLLTSFHIADETLEITGHGAD